MNWLKQCAQETDSGHFESWNEKLNSVIKSVKSDTRRGRFAEFLKDIAKRAASNDIFANALPVWLLGLNDVVGPLITTAG
jgi:hypothetical protein